MGFRRYSQRDRTFKMICFRAVKYGFVFSAQIRRLTSYIAHIKDHCDLGASIMQWTIVQPISQHDGTIWEWWDIQTSTNVNYAGRHCLVSKNMGYNMRVDKLNCELLWCLSSVDLDFTGPWDRCLQMTLLMRNPPDCGRGRHLQHYARLSAYRYSHRECLLTLMWQRSVA